MMQLQKYNDNTAPSRGEPYPCGRSSTRPSKLMPNNKGFKSGNEPHDKSFATIDDALEIVPGLERLASILKDLGERPYPLAVRKGVRQNMTEAQKSEQVKGGGSTYFLDIQAAATGKKYLRITQSRKAKGEDKFERISIFVFPEEAKEFGQKVSKMVEELR